MTREEAIARIKNHKIAHKMNEPRAIYISEALDMAIEALEQEPCEDAISRQAVLDAVEDDNRNGMWSCFASDDDAQKFKTVIKDLPPVKPQEPKTGHWIEDENEMEVWCSACGEENDECSRYCPNCGCRMVKPQESEE